jgi:5-methylcytosine-specific restriction endonuclease McrA
MSSVCKDCNKLPAIAKTGRRCLTCFRAFRAAAAAVQRRKLREKFAAENKRLLPVGKKICSRCCRIKRVSEFGTSIAEGRHRNKICDRCLTTMYQKRDSSDWYGAFRRRAYSINCAARQRLARIQKVAVTQITLKHLSYVCKPQDLAQLHTAQQGICAYCQVVLQPVCFSVDHTIPLSRGGRLSTENLVLCCHDCNRLKHDRTPEEFRQFLKEYLERWSA